MKILQVSTNNFDSEKEKGQRYSPLHFGYHELRDMGYSVDLLYPDEVGGVKLLYRYTVNPQYRASFFAP